MAQKISEIVGLIDCEGKMYYEVWIDYPFDKTGSKRTIIPMYSYNKESLRQKMMNAIRDKETIARKRHWKSKTPFRLLDCFPYLLGCITEQEAIKLL